MPSNLNSYAQVKDTVSSQNREVNPFLNDTPIELISYEDSNNLLTSLNITTGLGNPDKRRSLAKGIGFASGVMLALGSNGSRRSTNPIFKKVALTGTWTFAANNAIVNGTGGNLLTGDELRANEIVFTSSGLASQVQSVTGNNQFVLYQPYEVSGTSVTLYRMIPVSDYLSQIDLITTGYLYCKLSHIGNSLTYYCISHVNNGVVLVPTNSITVTGAAGWHYVTLTSLGVVGIETVPLSEIPSNTIQYSPNPNFNVSQNGYYSSVNTTRRIIGVLYFDGTNIVEVISYSTGKIKNDDLWIGQFGSNPLVNTANSRLQYLSGFVKSRGTNVTIVDNGGGSNDNYGTKITVLNNGYVTIFGSIKNRITYGGSILVSIFKNGSIYYQASYYANTDTININETDFNFNLEDSASTGDYYTFVLSSATNSSVNFIQLNVKFKEY